MAVRRNIPYSFGTFFITITNYKWMNLIEEVDGYDIIYKWYDYLKEQGNYIHSFVIMPNHIHNIISFIENGQNINTTVGNGKRFMAYEIIKRLERMNNETILSVLKSGVMENRKQKEQKHVVWEPSFDWKHCYSMEFIMQKLDYIHSNPCIGKWNLCSEPVDYPHSSARFYLTGDEGVYPVTDVGELPYLSLARE